MRLSVQKAVAKVEGILHDQTTVVIRSMWDDDLGHQLSGVMYEARYFLEDVKQRSTIRSQVLEHIITGFIQHQVPMASQPLSITSSQVIGQTNTNLDRNPTEGSSSSLPTKAANR